MGTDSEQVDLSSLPLPQLKGTLNLSRFEQSYDGSPRWMIHDPVSNEYYQLGWLEFECFSRMHKASTVSDLIRQVNQETSLEIDLDDVERLLGFLSENNLLALSSAKAQQKELPQKGLFSKILHGYLFFTLPILKPQRFLDFSIPYIRPLLSKGFLLVMVAMLITGMILTSARFDEFTHTFMQILTPGGILLSAITLIFIKIVHEFGHAYVATKYGIPVPHMGVAFIIMYPILYTETTASWRIAERSKRLHIGLAGVLSELYLAAFFLILWNITPDPVLQSICVTVIAISLIGSLLVNLNPLMRFDGYYILSDMMGIENLQNRAFDAARWQIRRWLFATDEVHPEAFTPTKTVLFMSVFGLCVLIYRFFLFLGIALLVYYLFFKPLGLFLMLVELWWFIGRPIWNELKKWYEMRASLFSSRRARITLSFAGVFLLLLVLPVNSQVHSKALMVPSNLHGVYSSEAADIESLRVENLMDVRKGDILGVLNSKSLQHDYNKAKVEHERLLLLLSKQSYLPEHLKPSNDLNAEIQANKVRLEQIENKLENLIIKAPFDGVIVDLNPYIHEGRSVSKTELLFRIKNKNDLKIVTFLPENAVSRLEGGRAGYFYPDIAPHHALPVTIETIGTVDSKELDWPEFSSLYGGHIASTQDHRDALGNPVLKPLDSAYLVTLKPDQAPTYDYMMVLKGDIRLSASIEVPLFQFFRQFFNLFLREVNLN